MPITRRNIKDIGQIIIHCSDSNWGDVEEIRKWHLERGFGDIGYHFVITNGRLKFKDKYNKENDGLIQKGRTIDKVGAHCKGFNDFSIGICLIGKEFFTGKQLYKSLPLLFSGLKYLNIKTENISCHYEFNGNKTCPNIHASFIKNIYDIVMFNPFLLKK